MVYRLQLDATKQSEREYILRMTMHHSIYIRILLHDLRVDVAFSIASLCAVDWTAVFNEVFTDVLGTRDNSWACRVSEGVYDVKVGLRT